MSVIILVDITTAADVQGERNRKWGYRGKWEGVFRVQTRIFGGIEKGFPIIGWTTQNIMPLTRVTTESDSTNTSSRHHADT